MTLPSPERSPTRLPARPRSTASCSTVNYAAGTGTNDLILTVQTPSTVYVDDSWAGTGSGSQPSNNPVAGGLVFGYNAFADVQSAIDRVAANGTLVVFGGTYAAPINVNKALQPNQINANSTLPGETVVNLNGAVTLTTDTAFALSAFTPPSSPGQNPANLTFGSTVNSGATARTLTVNGTAGRTLTFTGAVGGTSPLASLTTDAALTVNVTGGAVSRGRASSANTGTRTATGWWAEWTCGACVKC